MDIPGEGSWRTSQPRRGSTAGAIARRPLSPPTAPGPSSGGGASVSGSGLTARLDQIDQRLAVDAGLRYMALKNVSIDASFKYRWANPSYSYSATTIAGLVPVNFKYEPTYNLFSFQLGAAYHF